MPQSFRPFATASLALAAALACQPALAQSADAVKVAARKALQSNPEVLSRMNAYLAKGHAVDAAAAGFMPRVDLNAEVGADRAKNEGAAQQTLKRAGAGLTITQVLWDGQGTRSEVDRATHERSSRWFELADASEQTTLEAVRAVYDVQRQRKLVALAEDNLAQHKAAAAKIESRVGAGVGRGVDLDQARARLALAESNLDTELANLHDVAARYQRVVGETPEAELGALELLKNGMPRSPSEAVQVALTRSGAVAAAIENVRAARASEAGRKSALQPRVEARATVGGGENYKGIDSRRADAGVGVVLNWNLFDGGADRARVREQQGNLAQAMDLRDKACREVRQNAMIAFNDANKLAGQVTTLARNSAAIERAREAYRQQFDIGQRSLLDLLNAENEAYTARRALTNSAYDRAVAHARTLAAMSQLTTQLELARPQAPKDLADWRSGGDAAARCPAEPVGVDHLRGGVAQSGASALASMAVPVPQLPEPLPAPVASPVAAAAPAAAAALPKDPSLAAAEKKLRDWKQAAAGRAARNSSN